MMLMYKKEASILCRIFQNPSILLLSLFFVVFWCSISCFYGIYMDNVYNGMDWEWSSKMPQYLRELTWGQRFSAWMCYVKNLSLLLFYSMWVLLVFCRILLNHSNTYILFVTIQIWNCSITSYVYQNMQGTETFGRYFVENGNGRDLEEGVHAWLILRSFVYNV